jgi:hypothetical protein
MLLRNVGTRLHLVMTHKTTFYQNPYPYLIISPAVEVTMLDVQNFRPQYEPDTKSVNTFSLGC